MAALSTASTQPWFTEFCPNKGVSENLLITPVQRIPRYNLLLADLWKNTPEDHPDDVSLYKAIEFMKKVAAHVNLSVAKNQNFGKLTGEGLEHLLAAHRILLIDGEMHCTNITDFRRKKQEGRKRDYKFLLFNDVLVYYERDLKDKKDIKKRQQTWPLELIWLERNDRLDKDNSFLLTGPTKRMQVDLGAPEELERWWACITQAVDEQIEASHTHLKDVIPSFKDASLQMAKREATHVFKNDLIYKGEWDLGNMHGSGIMEYFGSIYKGDFELNKKHGNGILQYSDGHTYVGSFKNNRLHGEGTFTSDAKDMFVGLFADGKRCGHGEMLWHNGDKYVGDWKDDTVHGTGTMTTQAGITYVGQWSSGLFHGEGTLTDSKGTYSGAFLNGVKHGHGTMKFHSSKAESAHYSGHWKHGCMHGQGVMHDHQGIYEGEWRGGFRSGKGKSISKNGAIYEGMWDNDQKNGKGVVEDPAGYIKTYKGDFIKGVRQGRGYALFSSGVQYEGAFSEGLPHGHGVLTTMSPDGCVLSVKANFVRGVRDSKAAVQFEEADGTKITTTFDEEDELHELCLPPLFTPISWEH
eukprot:TRINITY_DN1519_c0_g1_i1.p1 TRINITY_DN1519_c0_g1~~TRINITY_DN1519_c0_g1_i1.p1  ORF type:complete len:595 (+),score=89.83 TRINITY_DN1519_c0_g1_i1:50-1786(+)